MIVIIMLVVMVLVRLMPPYLWINAREQCQHHYQCQYYFFHVSHSTYFFSVKTPLRAFILSLAYFFVMAPTANLWGTPLPDLQVSHFSTVILKTMPKDRLAMYTLVLAVNTPLTAYTLRTGC